MSNLDSEVAFLCLNPPMVSMGYRRNRKRIGRHPCSIKSSFVLLFEDIITFLRTYTLEEKFDQMKKNEIVLFETADHEVVLPVETDRETVWLTRAQMADLFDRDVKTIGKHIANALREELDRSAVAKFATTASDGKVYQIRPILSSAFSYRIS